MVVFTQGRALKRHPLSTLEDCKAWMINREESLQIWIMAMTRDLFRGVIPAERTPCGSSASNSETSPASQGLNNNKPKTEEKFGRTPASVHKNHRIRTESGAGTERYGEEEAEGNPLLLLLPRLLLAFIVASHLLWKDHFPCGWCSKQVDPGTACCSIMQRQPKTMETIC